MKLIISRLLRPNLAYVEEVSHLTSATFPIGGTSKSSTTWGMWGEREGEYMVEESIQIHMKKGRAWGMSKGSFGPFKQIETIRERWGTLLKPKYHQTPTCSMFCRQVGHSPGGLTNTRWAHRWQYPPWPHSNKTHLAWRGSKVGLNDSYHWKWSYEFSYFSCDWITSLS